MPLSMREIVIEHSSAAQQARDAFEAFLSDNVSALQQLQLPSTATAAVDSAPSAFGFLQEDPTPQPPSEPSAFGFLQEASAPEAVVGNAMEPEADIDLVADFQEYRAALECELCRWRVPSGAFAVIPLFSQSIHKGFAMRACVGRSFFLLAPAGAPAHVDADGRRSRTDGIDIASVVEVSDGGVRLVKSNEAVLGRAAALIRTNWDALVAKSDRVWQEAYAPIAAKCGIRPLGYAALAEYEEV
jgi:hypothetical protein